MTKKTILGLILVTLPLISFSSCSPAAKSVGAEKTVVAAPVAVTNLVGKWLRPDGGYILELRGATDDGKLDAAYFNPRPIHVSASTWRRSDEIGLVVGITLTDRGYPGATYLLRYVAKDDKLVGAYNQPAANQTFDVEFERQK